MVVPVLLPKVSLARHSRCNIAFVECAGSASAGILAHRSSFRVAPARPSCAIVPRLPVVHVLYRRAELCFHAVELGRISEGAVSE